MLPVAALLLEPEQALAPSTARMIGPQTAKDEKVDMWLTVHAPAAVLGTCSWSDVTRAREGLENRYMIPLLSQDYQRLELCFLRNNQHLRNWSQKRQGALAHLATHPKDIQGRQIPLTELLKRAPGAPYLAIMWLDLWRACRHD